jgi:hypothetical protein
MADGVSSAPDSAVAEGWKVTRGSPTRSASASCRLSDARICRDEGTLTLSRIVASLEDRASRPTRDKHPGVWRRPVEAMRCGGAFERRCRSSP